MWPNQDAAASLKTRATAARTLQRWFYRNNISSLKGFPLLLTGSGKCLVWCCGDWWWATELWRTSNAASSVKRRRCTATNWLHLARRHLTGLFWMWEKKKLSNYLLIFFERDFSLSRCCLMAVSQMNMCNTPLQVYVSFYQVCHARAAYVKRAPSVSCEVKLSRPLLALV